MSWKFVFFTYLNVWWIVLLAVLPWGVRRCQRPQEGHAVGAPERAGLKGKFLVTSLLAAVITGLIAWLIESGLIAVR